MYDLDTACGLIFDGTGYLDYNFSLPTVDVDGVIHSGTDNLLWDRLLNNCFDRFHKRYLELRADILSQDKLIAQYFEFIDSIPVECYQKEIELYPDSPQNNVSQKEQISSFLTARGDALDVAITTIYEVTK